MEYPLISAICPTFGRSPKYIHLLQECVYWFLRQGYPNKELVILNDAKYQRIECPYPGVRVVNVSKKFNTLGEKYDELVRLASGEIIMPWEDDDISLPSRMEQAARMLQSADYFNPQHSWFEQSGQLRMDHTHGVCHNASAYRRKVWEIIGGYGQTTGNQDAVFDGKTHVLNEIRRASPVANIAEWTYIYRWGVSPVHLSGVVDMDKLYRDVHAVPGIVFVEPRIYRDYHVETTAIVRGVVGDRRCRNPHCGNQLCGNIKCGER